MLKVLDDGIRIRESIFVTQLTELTRSILKAMQSGLRLALSVGNPYRQGSDAPKRLLVVGA
jgi:hypothetical protein